MNQLIALPNPRAEKVGAGTELAPYDDGEFDFSGLRVFASLPDHRDFGIVALRGMVVVYDERPLGQEGIIEGAFYVRESQRPPSCMDWEAWVKQEYDDRSRRVGPASPLKIQREVVQALRWPKGDHWSVRLSSGFVDGPYYDWAFGRDLIGKVAGVYLPSSAAKEG